MTSERPAPAERDATVNSYAPVLLAEDDENDIFMMNRAFTRAGVLNPLITVRNGQEAIDHLKGRPGSAGAAQHPAPCLLLLDLKMPLVDGFDVLAWLRRSKHPRRPMVVVLTSSARETDLAKAFKLGADAYLVKPADFNQLVVMVRDLRERVLEPPPARPKHHARNYEGRL